MTPLTDLLKVLSQLHQNKTIQMFKTILINKTYYFFYRLQTMRQCNVIKQNWLKQVPARFLTKLYLQRQ